MIENRLHEAVQELPLPTCSFTAVKERAAAADSNLSITEKLPVYSPASSCWQAVP